MRLFSEDINDAANNWKLRCDFNEPEKGLGVYGTVHTKSLPGFNVDWSRSEGYYKDINLACYDYLMKNVEEVYAKKEGMTDLKVTDKDADGLACELYAVINMPMFMSNRDLHVKFLKSEPKPSLYLYTSSTINKPDYPSPSGTLRMGIFAYSFVEMTDKGLHMIEYANADMKGYIPSSLLNMVLGSVTSKEYIDLAPTLESIKNKNGF